MRATALCALFLGLAAPAAAQPVAPESEGYSHILSAFTSGADPRVFSDGLVLGPALRRELGTGLDSVRIYDALIERAGTGRPSLRALRAGEGASFAAIPGINPIEPLYTLQAGQITLLLQYAPAQKRVSFVEQLHGPGKPPPPRAEPAPAVTRPAAAPKPEPVLAAPPPAPVPAPVPTPAPVAVVPAAAPAAAPSVVAVPLAPAPSVPPAVTVPLAPPPARVAAPVAAVPAAPVPTPATRAPAPQAKPLGPCVVKPVMSEEDLRNCAAAAAEPRPAMTETPAPAVAAPSAAAPTLQMKPAPRPCVIKAVMSEEDLRICAAEAARARPAMAESPAPAVAAPSAAAPALQAKPAPRPCVIKAVMSDEELRACGVRR